MAREKGTDVPFLSLNHEVVVFAELVEPFVYLITVYNLLDCFLCGGVAIDKILSAFLDALDIDIKHDALLS
jgi:hypothetical protein